MMDRVNSHREIFLVGQGQALPFRNSQFEIENAMLWHNVLVDEGFYASWFSSFTLSYSYFSKQTEMKHNNL